MSEIKISQLTVNYKTQKNKVIKAINDLSVTFNDGEFNVIIGASGSGKSTLIKTILGLINYDSGVILLDGADIQDYSISERNFAYVSQEIILFPHLTVFDNIAYPLKIRGVDKKTIVEKVNQLAKELDIEECLSRKPKQISLGQAQRAAIARTLIKNANFYFFDEPFSNLDLPNRELGRHLINKFIKNHHASAIYITHSIKEALSMGDRILVLDEGKILFSGSSKELLNFKNPIISSLISSDDYGK